MTLPKNVINNKELTDKFWTIWNIGAGVGLLGGLGLLAGAVFLTIFQYFYSETPHGSWLFLAVLPLWVLGAYCFDKIEAQEKSRQLKYVQKHSLTDDE